MCNLTLTGKELSPAQAFVTKHWGNGQPCPDVANMEQDEQTGVCCDMVGLDVRVRNLEGSPSALCPLVLSEASCAVVAAGLSLVALIPHSATSRSSDSVVGWFLFWCGKESCLQILDILSRAGCVRGDFAIAFPKRSAKDQSIGKGAYASVFCMQRWDGSIMAVKKFKSSVQSALVEREMTALMQVQYHENIVGVRGLFMQPEADVMRFSLVFEMAPYDLLVMVYKSGPLTEDNARSLFRGILQGVAHIHKHDIVHRDIKTENILIDALRRPLIADFGLATWLSDEAQMTKRCGSPGYAAPEMCLGRVYGCKVDVFGSGVLLYFMLSVEMPFSSPDMDAASVLKKTVACQLHLRRAPWASLSSPLRKILRATISKTAEDRLSAEEALEHVWTQEDSLTGVRSEAPKRSARSGAAFEASSTAPPTTANSVQEQQESGSSMAGSQRTQQAHESLDSMVIVNREHR